MTNEERDLIARFIARVGGGGTTAGFGASVPATRPNLPPVDPEADRFIGEQMSTHPEARYRVTQMAVVQEAALVEAQNRIRRLEWELNQARTQTRPAGGGFFGGLFGNRNAQPQTPPPSFNQGGPPPYGAPGGYGAPPQPQYPPNYQPGMFGRGGSGFLGSALTTAAGVAGGMVVGNALMDMFEGPRAGMGGGEGFGAGGGYGDAGVGADPFGGSGVGGADPWGGGGGDAGGGGDPWGGAGGDGGDPFGGGGGGWDDGGGDGGLF